MAVAELEVGGSLDCFMLFSSCCLNLALMMIPERKRTVILASNQKGMHWGVCVWGGGGVGDRVRSSVDLEMQQQIKPEEKLKTLCI